MIIAEKPTLAGIRLLEALPPEELNQLAERCAWRSYAAHQQIVSHNDDSRDVYFLVSGTARAIIYSVTGKPVIFRDFQAGEVFGEYSAMDGEPRSATVEALSACQVARMAPGDFWDVITTRGPVNEAMLRTMVHQIRGLTERVLEFSTLAVKNRLHAELLRIAEIGDLDDSTAIIASMPTHAELAGRISTHREAVTRELNRLNTIGLIKKEGHKTVITDIEKLESMVEEVLGEIILPKHSNNI